MTGKVTGCSTEVDSENDSHRNRDSYTGCLHLPEMVNDSCRTEVAMSHRIHH